VRTIGDDERRARLALRNGLAPHARAADPAALAGALGGVHATDPATVFLAARGRLARPSVQASSTRALVPGERKRFVGLLESADIADDGARGDRPKLAQDVPALREKIHVAPEKHYAAVQGVSTKVLFLLAAEGRVVRGRPLGSWTSALYRWAPIDSWLPADRRDEHEGRGGAARAPLAVSLRPGAVDRPEVVDGLDDGPRQARARAARDRRGRAGGRRAGARPRRGRGADRRARAAVRRAAAGARSCADGLAETPVVPRRAPRAVLRSQRQHRPDRLVRRPHRRRLGAAQGRWRGRRAPAGGHRRAGRAGGRRRGRAPARVDRRRAYDAALQDAAGRELSA
jgi:hypothetical protein